MTLPLTVLHMAQDDPKRNTAKKLARFELVHLVDKVQRVPRGAILLDPFAERALSHADRRTVEKRGLLALDCSWRTAEHVFPEVRARTVPRALPFLLAANHVNFGKPFQLTTAEALAASCAILREPEQAERLMSKFIWGPHFLTLNKQPLEDYAAADSSRGVVEAQDRFLPEEAAPATEGE